MPIRIAFFLAAGLAGLSFASRPAAAQATSEEVDGLTRVCRYGPVGNVLSEGAERTVRVGLGENCPGTYSIEQKPDLQAPPTAQLQGETLVDGRRSCIYQEAGRRWTLEAPAGGSCPPAAGMARTPELGASRVESRR